MTSCTSSPPSAPIAGPSTATGSATQSPPSVNQGTYEPGPTASPSSRTRVASPCSWPCTGAGPLAVSDLAVATGMNDPAVSQALRLLRTAGVVEGDKDGRVVRYRVTDGPTAELLEHC